MSALDQYNAHRSWTKQRGQEYVRGDFSDAAINELLAKLAAAEERVERLEALVSYLDDADDHNGMLIMQFEDAEEDAQ